MRYPAMPDAIGNSRKASRPDEAPRFPADYPRPRCRSDRVRAVVFPSGRFRQHPPSARPHWWWCRNRRERIALRRRYCFRGAGWRRRGRKDNDSGQRLRPVERRLLEEWSAGGDGLAEDEAAAARACCGRGWPRSESSCSLSRGRAPSTRWESDTRWPQRPAGRDTSCSPSAWVTRSPGSMRWRSPCPWPVWSRPWQSDPRCWTG